jgi:hypothetical protein
MPAFACLRVELPPAWTPKLEAIHLQLEKVVEAYLEPHWSWPRRFSHLSDLTFLLADPRVALFSPAELRAVADDLQRHLFGGGAEGEVALLLFEGPEPAVMAFARLSAEEVAAVVADPARLPPGGRLTRVRPGDAPVERLGEAPPATPAPASGGVHPTHRYEVGVLGTYLLSREIFVGDVMAIAPAGEPHHFSVVEDEAHLPADEAVFDEVCFRAAAELLKHKAGGLPLGVPVAYSHVMRASQGGPFAELLGLLPTELRAQLGACVYGAPHTLSHGAAPLHRVLDAHFSLIDLVTADPGFEVEALAPHSVASVVFCLREHDQHARQAALRAFAARRHDYHHRGIRQVAANLRAPAELELAGRLGLHLVSGPAVSGFLATPVGGRAVPAASLPVSR